MADLYAIGNLIMPVLEWSTAVISMDPEDMMKTFQGVVYWKYSVSTHRTVQRTLLYEAQVPESVWVATQRLMQTIAFCGKAANK